MHGYEVHELFERSRENAGNKKAFEIYEKYQNKNAVKRCTNSPCIMSRRWALNETTSKQ